MSMEGMKQETGPCAGTDKPVTVRKQKLRKNHIKAKLIFFIALAAGLLLTAVFARQLCPYDPYAQDLLSAQQPPGWQHILGTDRYGRDMFSRVLMGSTTSIFATLVLVAVITVTGTAIGIICGWMGGKVDTVLMRISDLFLAFPSLVFALAVAGVLGGGVQNAIIALAAIGWPKFARLARGMTLAQKDAPYLMAARLSGSSTAKLLVKHILPNIAGPVLVTAVLDIGTMMMELAGLSFLGLGVKPPMAEWGSMISDGRGMLQTAPWMVLAPGGAIFVTVMIFNLLGDTIRDYMDPKQRRK
ncbi:peptide/nickel transport system permease protein [Marvinbryantia formatexigens]|nr:peptide/nickel transport system permease protein [Marvinbryantia formatexigens]